jgi:hypothetical protein
MKNIDIIGGGTVSHVRNHLALCAPAYGTTARQLETIVWTLTRGFAATLAFGGPDEYSIRKHLTKMAGGDLETNEDVSKLVDQLIANPDTKIIFFNPALVDYDGSVTTEGPAGYSWNDSIPTRSGKYEERLKTAEGQQKMLITPTAKILGKIRRSRKDIFLVAFKTTSGATEDEQFLTGLHLLKTNSCNLVLANDTKTRMNMIITPEQARYYVTNERAAALHGLVEMALSRAKGTFTHSTVVPGDSVPWNMDRIPHALKAVVEHCIDMGAYKPFNGSTVGHFAFKRPKDFFITSKRKTDFNHLKDIGMVLCEANGDNEVIAYGAKPSVGGQSQRIIFKEHPEMDCIVHFHCPPKYPTELSVRFQVNYECGSHECGMNTSKGLREEIPGVKCVYLDNHGPNIVFNHKADPKEIIEFIDKNFDLSKSTDGLDRSL